MRIDQLGQVGMNRLYQVFLMDWLNFLVLSAAIHRMFLYISNKSIKCIHLSVLFKFAQTVFLYLRFNVKKLETTATRITNNVVSCNSPAQNTLPQVVPNGAGEDLELNFLSTFCKMFALPVYYVSLQFGFSSIRYRLCNQFHILRLHFLHIFYRL